MFALFLVDHDFATRERRLIERLEVGLAGEGVRILRAQPDTVPRDLGAEGVATRIVTYPVRGPLTSRSRQARRVAELVTEAMQDEDEHVPSVVHVFGSSLWGLGGEIARVFGTSWAVDVWSTAIAARASRWRQPRNLPPPVLLAPDPAIAEVLVNHAGPAMVRVAPWGAHAASEPRTILPDGIAPGIVMSATGRDVVAIHSAVSALADALAAAPDAMAFVDAGAASKAWLWPVIGRKGLESRVSLIPDLEVNRDMALAGDILIVPEATGECRSLVLDAMSLGVAVVAARDPLLTYLSGGLPVARFVTVGDRAGWQKTLNETLTDVAGTRQFAAAGWSFIRSHRRASAHVAAVLAAYEWMVSKDAVPFRAS